MTTDVSSTKDKRYGPTKPDTSRRSRLDPESPARGRSHAAGSGKTITDTASAIEITRQTVSEWLNHHPGFQAALHSRRQELWDGMADTLRGLLPKALEVVARELDGETPLPAAIHVLKACGLYGDPQEGTCDKTSFTLPSAYGIAVHSFCTGSSTVESPIV